MITRKPMVAENGKSPEIPNSVKNVWGGIFAVSAGIDRTRPYRTVALPSLLWPDLAEIALDSLRDFIFILLRGLLLPESTVCAAMHFLVSA